MDLRAFFQKVRKLESDIHTAHVIVVSLETPDGGKPDQMTEVTRETAAKIIVEGRARLATEAESAQYHSSILDAQSQREQQETAQKIEWAKFLDAGMRSFKNILPEKGKE
jgi:hypothetical protein